MIARLLTLISLVCFVCVYVCVYINSRRRCIGHNASGSRAWAKFRRSYMAIGTGRCALIRAVSKCDSEKRKRGTNCQLSGQICSALNFPAISRWPKPCGVTALTESNFSVVGDASRFLLDSPLLNLATLLLRVVSLGLCTGDSLRECVCSSRSIALERL